MVLSYCMPVAEQGVVIMSLTCPTYWHTFSDLRLWVALILSPNKDAFFAWTTPIPVSMSILLSNSNGTVIPF